MAQPVWPSFSVPSFPNPKFVTRTRREIDTHDAVNARQFEHWQTDGKYDTMNRPDLNKQAPFYDMLPNDSRTNDKSYRPQPRFDVDGHRGGMNSYFDKYDTAFDARNMTRELRASVYEDKNTGYLEESKHLLQRNFDNRWLNPGVAKEQADISEQLRPKMDDIHVFYRNKTLSSDSTQK